MTTISRGSWGRSDEGSQTALDRVPGAELLLLDGRPHVRGDLGQVRLDLVALVSDDDHDLLRLDLGGGGQCVAEHRVTGQLVQQLRLDDFIRVPPPAASTITAGGVAAASGAPGSTESEDSGV